SAAPTAPLLQGVDVAQGADQAAGALVGLAFGCLVAGAFGSASGTQFRAALARRVGFGIEGLGDAGGSAGIAEPEYGHFEQFGRTLDLQRLAAAQRARRLGPLAIDFDLAVLDRLARQAARLEEARRPQPEVEAHRVRGLLRGGGGGFGGGLGLGVAGQVFLDPRLAALEATQVVQLARADLAAALHLHRVDRG